MTNAQQDAAAMLAQFDPPEAKHIHPGGARPRTGAGTASTPTTTRRPTTRKLVKAYELPKTYEDFAKRKEWAGKVAIDDTDIEWLEAMYRSSTASRRAPRRSPRTSPPTLKPVLTDGHLAMARATGGGRVLVLAQQLRQSDVEREARRRPDRVLRARSGARCIFGAGRRSAPARRNPNAARLAANFMISQECQQFLAKFGRLPTRSDVKDNPPGTVEMLQQEEGHPDVADTGRREGLAAQVH